MPFKKGNKINLGRHYSRETRQRISEAHKGNHYALGNHFHHTNETKEKIRQANLGKHHSLEWVENNRQADIRAWANPDLREKVSQSQTRVWTNPELRRMQRERHLGAKSALYIDGRSKLGYQYRGDDWPVIRRQILARDEQKCDFSNTGECRGRLAVHHLVSYHGSHNNNPGNLITLCNYHHGIVEHDGGA